MEVSRPTSSRSSRGQDLPPPPAYDEAAVFPASFPTVPTHSIVLPSISPQNDTTNTARIHHEEESAVDSPASILQGGVPMASAQSEELDLLVDMGIDREWAALSLKRCGNNISEAAMFCLENMEQKESMLLEESIELRRCLAVEAMATRGTESPGDDAVEPPDAPAAADFPAGNERRSSKGSSRFKNIFPWRKRSRSGPTSEALAGDDAPSEGQTDEPIASAPPLDAPELSERSDSNNLFSMNDPPAAVADEGEANATLPSNQAEGDSDADVEVVATRLLNGEVEIRGYGAVTSGDVETAPAPTYAAVVQTVRAADSDDESADGIFDTCSSLSVAPEVTAQPVPIEDGHQEPETQENRTTPSRPVFFDEPVLGERDDTISSSEISAPTASTCVSSSSGTGSYSSYSSYSTRSSTDTSTGTYTVTDTGSLAETASRMEAIPETIVGGETMIVEEEPTDEADGTDSVRDSAPAPLVLDAFRSGSYSNIVMQQSPSIAGTSVAGTDVAASEDVIGEDGTDVSTSSEGHVHDDEDNSAAEVLAALASADNVELVAPSVYATLNNEVEPDGVVVATSVVSTNEYEDVTPGSSATAEDSTIGLSNATAAVMTSVADTEDSGVLLSQPESVERDPFDSTAIARLTSWDDSFDNVSATRTFPPAESNEFEASGSIVAVSAVSELSIISEEHPPETVSEPPVDRTVTVRQTIHSLPRAMTIDNGGASVYRINGEDVMTADAIDGQRESEIEFVPLADAMVSIGDGINVPPEVSGAYISDGTQLYMTIAAPIGHDEEDNAPAVIPEPMPTRQQSRGIRHYFLGSEGQSPRNDQLSGIPRRQLLEPTFVADPDDSNIIRNVILNLKQPKLGSGKKTPQGHRPNRVVLKYKGLSLREAKSLAEANAPPIWSGEGDPLECTLCQRSHGVFRPLHHCRNCGYYVCDNCSDKYWPSSMIPECYHNQETIVRTCDSCNILMESFNDALRRGDAQAAFAAFSSGNVNIHCPLTVYKSEEYPIHCAVRGGNLMLVRWLIETKQAAVARILPNGNRTPLVTTKGISCLGIAAYYGHSDILKYLVQKRGCSLMEITDADVLRRGLHAVVEAPGPLPPIAGKGAWFQKKAVPHSDASTEELHASSSHGQPSPPAPAPTASRPAARGHLVTGNPRYQDAIVASSASVPDETSPQLAMQITGRPKQQHFRHKPVSNNVMQRTLLALQHTSNNSIRTRRGANRRSSAPSIAAGTIDSSVGTVARRQSVATGSGIASSPLATSALSPLTSPGGVLNGDVSSDAPDIDFTQNDDAVMHQIIMEGRRNNSEYASAEQTPPPVRVRNITDAYIVPYNDEDITAMSTPR